MRAYAVAPCVAQMSLQRSQTSSGTTPTRMRTAKALQPRQRPKADSRSAAAASRPRKTSAAVQSAEAGEDEGGHGEGDADALGEALGRPGHRALARCARRGVTTRVTNWPSGLRVGPVSTRATKP